MLADMERALLKPSTDNHLHMLIEYVSRFRARSVFCTRYVGSNLNLQPSAAVHDYVVVDLIVNIALCVDAERCKVPERHQSVGAEIGGSQSLR